MRKRVGITIIEVFIVLVIITVLLGLLLPVIRSTRERAREAVCKNNVHQMNIAVAHFAQAHKQLPRPSPPGRIGGWMIEILPFVEQGNLKHSIPADLPTTDAPEAIFRPPPLYRCPSRTAIDSASTSAMWPAHYVFLPTPGRESSSISDAPVKLKVAWVSGPEMTYSSLITTRGPHSDGFFISAGSQQGVRYLLNGRVMY